MSSKEEKMKKVKGYCYSCDCEDCIYDKSNYSWCRQGTVENLSESSLDEIMKELNITDADNVNRPNHYTHGIECIDEMIAVFGELVVANFCICNVWKYRKRAIYKNGEEDMNKADWYMKKYLELTKRVIENGND